MIRDTVQRFVALGPLPDDSAPAEEIDKHSDLLDQIGRPVTDEEAFLLLQAFGEGDCFGVAWNLLHLIETAPHSPVSYAPQETENEWIRRLWARAQRGQSALAKAE